MKFFVPQVAVDEYQQTYDGIAKSVKEQLRIPIVERKVFSLNYVQDKKRRRVEVGKLEPAGRYVVLAIFEAKPYIIFTRAENGDHGVTILVNGDEVTSVEDFD